MDGAAKDAAAFFSQHEDACPLFELFEGELLARFPDTRVKVQKSQISYYNCNLFGCVSFMRARKKAELAGDHFVLTLGLLAPLESERVAAKTGPHPGRWTTHFVISGPSDLGEEMFGWVTPAYWFAQGMLGAGSVRLG